MEIYSYTKGYSSTEQTLVTYVDDFLQNDVGGWELYYEVSDTASNRDYVWRSYGTVSGVRSPIYIRIRAESDYLYLYGYVNFTDPDHVDREIYNATYTRIPTSSAGFRYWLIGNKDFLQVHVQQTDYYMGYLGYINSYYSPEKDDCPLLVRGQSNSSTYWSSSTSVYMHDAVASGTQAFKAYSDGSPGFTGECLTYDVGLRSQEVLCLPPVLYCDTVGKKEVRGEPYGVYVVNAPYVGHQAQVLTVSGTFLSFKIYNTNGYLFGPISSGTCSVF